MLKRLFISVTIRPVRSFAYTNAAKALVHVCAYLRRKTACALTAIAVVVAAPGTVWALADCKYPPSKPVTLKNMGPCEFNLDLQSFAGDAAQQAACLARHVLKGGKIGDPRENLPAVLAERVGRSFDLPDRGALFAVLQERGLDAELGINLSRPVSRANDDHPFGRAATYFVIHDTSGPNFRSRQFPDNINHDVKYNTLANFLCLNGIERAHVFINRLGAVMMMHDLEKPWRATKFEMATDFRIALKGLFLHTELIQPRRRAAGFGRNNDFEAPNPGFTPPQYDTLALVYTVASVRAGFWMIPAFHAVLDEGIYDKHDDPQNFDFDAFVRSFERLLNRLHRRDGASASPVP
ncbi:MAG: hypothetical protein HY659_10130 [Rhizobiales bacterium]|nr:hypothetical protein [Hyphomicrobiales bacterium]